MHFYSRCPQLWLARRMGRFPYGGKQQAISAIPAMGTKGMGIFIAAPVLTWLVLRAFMGDGWCDAGLRPLIKKNLRWYGVATLI